jgi:hypothetical protein
MWKASGKESFSKVIMRVVPVTGTLGALLVFVDEAGTSLLTGNDTMEDAIDIRPTVKHDPWS